MSDSIDYGDSMLKSPLSCEDTHVAAKAEIVLEHPEISRRHHRGARLSFMMVSSMVVALIGSCVQTTLAFAPSSQGAGSIRSSHRRSTLDKELFKPSDTHSTSQTARNRMSSVAEAPSSQMSDFQRRMRNLVTPRKKTPEKKGRSRRPSNVKMVRTLEEYKKEVGSVREEIVVVRFYATWCKACKAIEPSFYRMANSYEQVKFVEVPVTDKNANLHQGLGVPSLPFGHIYHPQAGLVEEEKISRKFFANFERKLHSYVSGTCEIPDDCEYNSPYVLRGAHKQA